MSSKPTTANAKRAVLFGLKLLVGGGLLALLVSYADWGQFLSHAKELHVGYLLCALATMQIGISVQVLRWSLSLRPLGLHFSYMRLFWVNYIGLFFNNFLPGSVSGDALKVYYLGRKGSWGRLAVGTVITRALGFVSLFATNAALLATAHLASNDLLPWNSVLLWTGFLALGVAGAVVLYVIPQRFAVGMIRRFVPRIRARKRLRQLFHDIEQWRNDWRLGWMNLILSFVYTIVGIAFTIWFCGRAANVDLPMAAIMATGLTVISLSIIPISFNGVGVAEASYAALLGAAGVPIERALLLALLMRMLLLFQGVLGGICYVFVSRTSASAGGSAEPAG